MNQSPLVRKFLTLASALVVILATLPLAARPVMARENGSVPGPAQSSARPPAQGPTDPAEMETFLDGLLATQMKEHHIAGAAVSVVKDGQVFFDKGYGYANIEKGIAVDPEQTIFPIGSISKLFTWTAVMQLVEQGKLNLDTDINTYLDFHIPDTYPEPITLRHLMTHTPGFEERMLEFDALKPEDLVPSGEWLASHIPARVRPPGAYAGYSNYGTALAGYIVERVSGESYSRYIQEHILGPLDMRYTSAQTPLPPELRQHASQGYTDVDGAFRPFPEYLAQLAIVPAGGMQASAGDMARFMIAHLQNGHYSDANMVEARILNETTAQKMHSTQYTPDPRLLGTTYGFFEFTDNGQRTIGHSGGAHPFYTLLLLLPEQKMGVFVAYNGTAGEELTLQHLGFQRAFFDHYFAASAAGLIQPPQDFAQRAGRFVGDYRITESSYTSLEKYRGLMGGVAISDPHDGTLLLKTPWRNWRFVEVAPLYFRQVDGPFALVFREDDQGRIAQMFTDITPMFSFEKLNWYETPGFNLGLALACLLIFLSMITVLSIGALRNRSLRGDGIRAPRGARVTRGIILGISILNLLFVTGMMVWGTPAPIFGISMMFKIVLGLGVLSAGLAAGGLVCLVFAWKNSYWSTAVRVHYTLVVLAGAAFIWFLNNWNLLGWRF